MKTALLYALLVAGQSADVATTCVGLRSGQFVERNPLLPSTCGRIALTKALTTGATAALYRPLRKTHPKLAVAVLVVPGMIGAGMAAYNLRVMAQW